MDLQVTKNKLYDIVDMLIESQEGSWKEGLFVIINKQGIIVNELTYEEAANEITNCNSIEELENLVLEKWLLKREYKSLQEIIYTTMGE